MTQHEPPTPPAPTVHIGVTLNEVVLILSTELDHITAYTTVLLTIETIS